MPFVRRHARPLAALAAVSACAGALSAQATAAPASADGTLLPPSKPGPAPLTAVDPPPATPLAGAPLIAWLPGEALTAAREAAEQAGPFHPVLGAHDYGEFAGRYGADRGGRMHEGQDVFAPAGTPLVAVADGVVVETGNDGGRGNYLALYVPADGVTYNYLHMLAPAPHAVGARVAAGERVGAVGCTGSCWGDHLHFEARAGRGANGPTDDPLPLLLRWPQAPAG